MTRKTKGYLLLAILAVFGFSTLAFAQRGYGHDRMMGPEWPHGSRCSSNLTPVQRAKLDRQCSEFLDATEHTGRQLYNKEMALREELARDDPDTALDSRLQSDISKLRSDLDRKRLEYEIQARKSVPGYNPGYFGGGHMMDHGMMRYGYYDRDDGEYCMRWPFAGISAVFMSEGRIVSAPFFLSSFIHRSRASLG